MLMADDERRYVDANRAACLLLRVPRVRVLELRVDDLTPPEHRAAMQTRWEEFIQQGTQAGLFELMLPDGQRVEVCYSATANFRPGRHISILEFPQEPSADGAYEPGALSAREREVLTLVAMGETSPSISAVLHISVTTVDTHIRNCLAKLGAKNRPHAVGLGLMSGEIGLDLAG